MPSFSESDPNLDCDEEQNTTANQNHDLNSSTTTEYKDDDMNNAEAEASSNDLLDETNGLGNASVSLADLDLSSDTLNEDLGASRGSPYRNDSNGRVKTYINGCIFKIHPLRYTVKCTSTGVFSKIGKF